MGDMTETLAAKSDQINAIDLVGGPITVTVTKAKVVGGDQPVSIWTAELGEERPYKPCLSMRRVIVKAWGADSSTYAGKRMTLFNDPTVKWAGAAVGGLRISHLSDIDKPLNISLPESKGKQKPHHVDPLPAAPPPPPKADTAPSLGDLFDKAGLPKDRANDRLTVTRKVVGRPEIASAGDLTPGELGALTTQLIEWDRAGDLTNQVGDILDQAAIDSAIEAEAE